LIGCFGTDVAIAVEYKEENIFEPMWENVASITLDMTFSNAVITSSGSIIGRNGTTAINATFVLARRNVNGTFTEVDRWSATNGSIPSILITSRTTRNQLPGTYRLSVTAHVTRNSRTETVFGDHTATLR